MIAITDAIGRQYRFAGEEERIIAEMLREGFETGRQLITNLIEFETHRKKLINLVLDGRHVNGYGYPYKAGDWEYRAQAIKHINQEYGESLKALRTPQENEADLRRQLFGGWVPSPHR